MKNTEGEIPATRTSPYRPCRHPSSGVGSPPPALKHLKGAPRGACTGCRTSGEPRGTKNGRFAWGAPVCARIAGGLPAPCGPVGPRGAGRGSGRVTRGPLRTRAPAVHGWCAGSGAGAPPTRAAGRGRRVGRGRGAAPHGLRSPFACVKIPAYATGLRERVAEPARRRSGHRPRGGRRTGAHRCRPAPPPDRPGGGRSAGRRAPGTGPSVEGATLWFERCSGGAPVSFQ